MFDDNKYSPRLVSIGGLGNIKCVKIGGNAPISIQTMWKEGITNVLNDDNALSSVIKRLESLSLMGCDIVRFAVPDMESADALIKIAQNTSVPLVADIHFDYKLALRCLDGPISKIRINPGNIGERSRVESVVQKCRDKGIPIRIGVNTGSFPRDIADRVENGTMMRAEGLAETAAREVAVLDELDFNDVIVSMKASSVQETIEANEEFARHYNIPLHIGVTEAGPLIAGVVKSTLAFSHLLQEGIGSTIRVSLSSTPENEVIAAREILRENGCRSGGIKIVSCPRCGRNGFDVHGFVNRWQNRLMSIDKDITVAVMGCVVNGPGEGKHADIGITGAGDSVIIFKKGKIVKTIKESNVQKLIELADNSFMEELKSL